jgi:hypothetical protein
MKMTWLLVKAVLRMYWLNLQRRTRKNWLIYMYAKTPLAWKAANMLLLAATRDGLTSWSISPSGPDFSVSDLKKSLFGTEATAGWDEFGSLYPAISARYWVMGKGRFLRRFRMNLNEPNNKQLLKLTVGGRGYDVQATFVKDAIHFKVLDAFDIDPTLRVKPPKRSCSCSLKSTSTPPKG